MYSNLSSLEFKLCVFSYLSNYDRMKEGRASGRYKGSVKSALCKPKAESGHNYGGIIIEVGLVRWRIL